jgi:hypothetical protein
MRHSKVKGTKMFPMMSKKDKTKRPLRKQKHKTSY